MQYRKQTNQVYRYLSELLYNSNYKNIHYNPHQHQKSKKGINTCGRHSGLFIKFGVEPEEYNKIIKFLKKKLGYKCLDKMVTDLTDNFFI